MKSKKYIAFIWMMLAFSLMEAHAMIPHDHNMSYSFDQIQSSEKHNPLQMLLLDLGEEHLENFNTTIFSYGFLLPIQFYNGIGEPYIPQRDNVHFSLIQNLVSKCIMLSLPHRAPPAK